MKNISVFQIVVLAICLLVAIVGVAIFAGFGGSNKSVSPTATIWGTLSAANFTQLVSDENLSGTKINVTYVQKDPSTFQSDLVNALADGTGPDIALLDDTMLYTERDKIIPIPLTTYPARNFEDTFIDDASIFVDPNGILAVPLTVDPLVMYWNKNILSAAGISAPPSTWVGLQAMAPSVIQKTDASTITQAFVAFGEYSNVTNAKQILATMLFQLGNPITQLNTGNDQVAPVIDQSPDNNAVTTPIESVINFYTAFANPSNNIYTWNLSMPDSLDDFLAGNLALYFGYASELADIQNKNPNLNFDVAEVPQDAGTIPATYGKITGFAIMKNTQNYAGALAVISALTSSFSIARYSQLSGLPPVRRDLLALPAPDVYQTIFYRAAVKARAWFDPDPVQSDAAFQGMIESITTGTAQTTGAITNVVGILTNLFAK